MYTMSCFHPLKAFDTGQKTDSGKTKYVICSYTTNFIFDKKFHLKHYDYVEIPCGQCIGCRLDYSKQWAIRCCLEASLYKNNYFLTLTYDEEHCPNSLNKDDFRKFLNSLRKHFSRRGHDGIRFLVAGEYGSSSMRPHYHAILFNCPFYDLKLECVKNGHSYWSSSLVDSLWNKGFVSIGLAEYDSMSYVAQYILKKHKGVEAKIYDDLGIMPEYLACSNHPGIGRAYFDKYSDQIYKDDSIYFAFKPDLVKSKPPKYFDRLFSADNPELMELIKGDRDLSRVCNRLNEMSLTDSDFLSYTHSKEDSFVRKTKILNKRSVV